MKPLLVLLLAAGLAGSALAQSSFPGLKSVLTAEEWTRAGLDRLTPDQIGVIDAALIRHARASTGQLQNELAAARAQAAAAPAPAATTASDGKPRGAFERFGLPFFDATDWRSLPPLRARVVAWETPNRFRLDNGQVWEGYEPIPYELVGRDIEIHARPNNQFALVLDGKATGSRLFRLR